MTEFIAPSGAKVKIALAAWRDAVALKAAIAKEIIGSKVELDAGIFSGEAEINLLDITKLAALVDSSEAVYNAVFACLLKSTRDGERISENTFEPENARQDYYPIVIACLKENLAPFFKSLLSELKPVLQAYNHLKAQSEAPKSL